MELFLNILATVCILLLSTIMYIDTYKKELQMPKWLQIVGRICIAGYLLFFVYLIWGW